MPGDTPPPPKSSPFHPALTVSNIRNHVRLVLDADKVLYSSWSTLFLLHPRAYKVLQFIDGSPRSDDLDDTSWSQSDAVVLQWIYSTLSDDLVIRILETTSTAREAWIRLENMFRDNKGARAAQLENLFISTKLEQFANIGEYCQTLKSLADQLGDVDNTISQQRRVLQLVNGLTNEFDTVGTVIQQTNPLPDFATARSMLLLEEQRHAHKSTNQSIVLTIQTQSTAKLPAANAAYGRPPNPNNHRGGHGRGKKFGRGRGRNSGFPQQQPWFGQQHSSAGSNPVWFPQQMGQQFQTNTQWAHSPNPVSPRPDWLPSQQSGRSTAPGILGPRPPGPYGRGQALLMPHATDLSSAFNGLTLQPPDDTWYMDTGATSHLTNNSGYPDGTNYYEVQ